MIKIKLVPVEDTAFPRITQSLKEHTKNWTPWPESANKIYWPTDHLLSTKLVPTLADRGCHVVSVINLLISRSQWPRCLRHELSSPAPTLGSWVRIPLSHGCLCVFCVRIISELKLLIKSLIWIAWSWQNGLSSPTPNDIWIIKKNLLIN
jgi:hypothetical protein